MTRTVLLAFLVALPAGCVEIQDFGSPSSTSASDSGARRLGDASLADAGPDSPGTLDGASFGDASSAASTPRWNWASPTPTGANMAGIWVLSDTDAWLVGAAGSVLRWDGTTVHDVSTGWAGDDYYGVWASSDSDVWVIGTRAIHWDGSKWSAPSELNSAGPLYSVWGTSSTDVWLVATPDLVTGSGGCYHFDGVHWVAVSLPFGQGVGPRDVWGSSPTDVWAVGDGIAHYDGTAWTTTLPPWTAGSAGAAMFYTGVWGAGASDVWTQFVSQQSSSAYTVGFAHFDGTQWSTSTSKTIPTSVPNEQALGPVASPLPVGRQIWGTGAGQALSIAWDGTPWQLSAGSWQPSPSSTAAQQSVFPEALGGAVGGASWGAADDGQIVRMGSAQTWTGVLRQPRNPFSSVTVARDGSVFAASGAQVFLWGTSGWTNAFTMTLSALGIPDGEQTLFGPVVPLIGAASAVAANDVWVAGSFLLDFSTGSSGGTSCDFAAHWNGASFDAHYLDYGSYGLTPSDGGIAGLWADSPMDAWVAFQGSTGLVRWNGTSWEKTFSGMSREAASNFQGNSVWGSGPNDVWFSGFVGASATVLHWDGSQLGEAYRPPGYAASSVWGSGSNDVWVGAEHWDGTSWTAVAGGAAVGAGWSSGPNDAWMIMSDTIDTLSHWDGTTVSPVFSTGGVPLTSIAGSGAANVWAVGKGGATIQFRVPPSDPPVSK